MGLKKDEDIKIREGKNKKVQDERRRKINCIDSGGELIDLSVSKAKMGLTSQHWL